MENPYQAPQTEECLAEEVVIARQKPTTDIQRIFMIGGTVYGTSSVANALYMKCMEYDQPISAIASVTAIAALTTAALLQHFPRKS